MNRSQITSYLSEYWEVEWQRVYPPVGVLRGIVSNSVIYLDSEFLISLVDVVNYSRRGYMCGSPDPLLAASRYVGYIGAVVLGETGPLWLWERGVGIFKFSEKTNRSQITSYLSEYWEVEWQRDLTLDPFSMLTEELRGFMIVTSVKPLQLKRGKWWIIWDLGSTR